MSIWSVIGIDKRIKGVTPLGEHIFGVKYDGKAPDALRYYPEDGEGRKLSRVHVYHYQLLNGLHVVVPEQDGSLWFPYHSQGSYRSTNDLGDIILQETPHVTLDYMVHRGPWGGLASAYKYETNRGEVELTLASTSPSRIDLEGPSQGQGLFDEIRDIEWASIEDYGLSKAEVLRTSSPVALIYTYSFLNGVQINIGYNPPRDGQITTSFREFNLGTSQSGRRFEYIRREIDTEMLGKAGIDFQLPEKIYVEQLEDVVRSVIRDTVKGTVRSLPEYIRDII